MAATVGAPWGGTLAPAPRARVTAGPALSVIGVGAVLVVLLWWRDTPPITNVGDWLTNAGRLTGLGAGYAVVVLLALMARIPALERGVGSDRLARWHAMGGRYTVSLAVAHTLLIIWGYAVTAHVSVVSETGTLVVSYPDVLMATVALGLLVAVGITCARAARRRLNYETWHFIHLYTYLAIALALSHQFATGAEFSASRPARVFWSLLYIAVAAALLWFRLLSPLIGSLRRDLRVAGTHVESPQVLSVYIRGRDLDRLRADAGQFFRWRFLNRELWWAANPYSLSAPARPDVVRITVKASGAHSLALERLRPGTRVIAEGPSGGLIAARRRSAKVLLLAGGVGITPLRTLFETLPGDPGDVVLLYRVNSVLDLVFRDELDAIARQRGAAVHYLVGPPRRGMNDHLAPRRLASLVPDIAERDVYLCGPEPMMTAARTALRELGVPRAAVHAESFAF